MRVGFEMVSQRQEEQFSTGLKMSLSAQRLTKRRAIVYDDHVLTVGE